ncbi:MAG: hypothetical protein HQL12_01070 [Candidatus Omnitrophica bacterium]|nr:hypothetical protein [Candidatus Omnitrophota bacterium]
MILKKIIPYFLLILLCLSGCSAFENIDQISLLGQFSREQDNQHRLVKSINDHYDALTKIIAEGRISEYKNEASFVHSFGDPIIKKDLRDGTQQWLYRYAIYRTAKDEVNIYFDHDGKQVKWEKLTCQSFY